MLRFSFFSGPTTDKRQTDKRVVDGSLELGWHRASEMAANSPRKKSGKAKKAADKAAKKAASFEV
jgi:hypothetical protein